MAKLSDKQRKKIIAEYIEGGISQRKLAEKYHVSPYLIRTILNSDKELTQKISHKKEENVASVLEYMDSKKKDVCDLIDALLVAMNDPQKIAATPLSQLATAMGIVIDKYTLHETPTPTSTKENNFFEAILSAGKEADLSGIPELQSTTNDDTVLVDETGTQK